MGKIPGLQQSKEEGNIRQEFKFGDSGNMKYNRKYHIVHAVSMFGN